MLLLINIVKIIKTNDAISYDDGQILFDKIVKEIKSGMIIVLDFSGTSFLTTTFLTSSIGQLYNHFTSEEIEQYFSVKNICEDHRFLLEKVILSSKEFKSNPKVFEDIVNEVIYGD